MIYQKQDFYFKQAKGLGYRSRAAFKLLDIQKKFKVIKKGDVVLDLGCAPGSWTQVASKIVGNSGAVIGVDTLAVEEFPNPKVTVLKEDVTSNKFKKLIKNLLAEFNHSGFDVLLSDMAPNPSGIINKDQHLSYVLSQEALKIAQLFLKRNGNLVIKGFEGEKTKTFKKLLEDLFEKVNQFRPPSTRKQSKETYLIGLNKK